MVEEIDAAYRAQGNLDLGWRFLYSPKATLTQNTGVAIIGLNPGGDRFSPPLPSVEKGNAWLASVESWPSRNTQPYFATFFRSVLAHRGINEIAPFLNRCLTSNLVPFRTRNAAELPLWALTWGTEFWRRHAAVLLTQRIIVAIGNDSSTKSPYSRLQSLFARDMSELVEAGEMAAGWGTLAVRYATYRHDLGETTLIGVPHFSRFETRDPNTIKWIASKLH